MVLSFLCWCPYATNSMQLLSSAIILCTTVVRSPLDKLRHPRVRLTGRSWRSWSSVLSLTLLHLSAAGTLLSLRLHAWTIGRGFSRHFLCLSPTWRRSPFSNLYYWVTTFKGLTSLAFFTFATATLLVPQSHAFKQLPCLALYVSDHILRNN